MVLRLVLVVVALLSLAAWTTVEALIRLMAAGSVPAPAPGERRPPDHDLTPS